MHTTEEAEKRALHPAFQKFSQSYFPGGNSCNKA